MLCEELAKLKKVTSLPTTPIGWLSEARFRRVFGVAIAHGDAPPLVLTDQDLSNRDLSELFLMGGTFLRCDMQHSRLEDITLHGVTFVDCDMRFCRWKRAKVSGSLFHGSDLRSSNAHGGIAQAMGAEFSWCHLPALNGEVFLRGGGAAIYDCDREDDVTNEKVALIEQALLNVCNDRNSWASIVRGSDSPITAVASSNERFQMRFGVPEDWVQSFMSGWVGWRLGDNGNDRVAFDLGRKFRRNYLQEFGYLDGRP